MPVDSDRIVGVQFSFQLIDMPVDIFPVYFPSTNYTIDEYKECLALFWALFEIYCDIGLIIILGDLNGSLGSTKVLSTIHTIHTIQTQTEFRPVQHCYCHLNKKCNLNQSKDDSFVGRVAKNNT